MGCEEVREALDAYALGALTPEEAKAVETHVAGCPECRKLLDEANHVASLLPFGVPLWNPSPQLRSRILSSASQWAEAREAGWRGRAVKAALPIAAALLLAFAVGSLAWSVRLQGEVTELNNDLNNVQRQVQFMGSRQGEISTNLVSVTRQIGYYEELMGEQRTVFGTLTAPDVRTVKLWSKTRGIDAKGIYFWSAEYGTAGVTCTNLPELPEGQVYHLWFFKEGKAYSGGTFKAHNGIGLHVVELSEMGLQGPFFGYGVSIESVGPAALWPTSELVLYAEN
jgi:hypothetical protein